MILLVLDPSLALVTFLTFPVLLVAGHLQDLLSTGAYRLTWEKIAQVTAYLQETLSGVRVVRAFGQEPRHRRRFAELNDEHREANMRTVHLQRAYFPAVELLSAVATAAILIYGGNQVLDGKTTIGVLASFVFYLQTFFDPIQSLSQLYTTYQAEWRRSTRSSSCSTRSPTSAIARRGGACSCEGDRVRRRDLRYGGSDDAPALHGVSLLVPPGQTVALVGATGAGKSPSPSWWPASTTRTRARCASMDTTCDVTTSLRSQLGVVPQESFLFSGTIGDNIAFGNPDAGDDDVRAAARAVGARVHRAATRGLRHRGGRARRPPVGGSAAAVAFARAAAADPRILILDEATSNVDVRTESQIERRACGACWRDDARS